MYLFKTSSLKERWQQWYNDHREKVKEKWQDWNSNWEHRQWSAIETKKCIPFKYLTGLPIRISLVDQLFAENSGWDKKKKNQVCVILTFLNLNNIQYERNLKAARRGKLRAPAAAAGLGLATLRPPRVLKPVRRWSAHRVRGAEGRDWREAPGSGG